MVVSARESVGPLDPSIAAGAPTPRRSRLQLLGGGPRLVAGGKPARPAAGSLAEHRLAHSRDEPGAGADLLDRNDTAGRAMTPETAALFCRLPLPRRRRTWPGPHGRIAAVGGRHGVIGAVVDLGEKERAVGAVRDRAP